MIPPTVGRVVWVIRPGLTSDIGQPEVGFITYVHGERCINVAGFNANGTHFVSSSLTLLQDDDAKPEGASFAVWMPYQKGQAAKADVKEVASAKV